MPLESKRIAALMLTQPNDAAWQQAIEVENILQKKTPATSRRQATLIRKRLNTLDPEAWTLIVQREQEVAVQLLLVAALNHSQLLRDFLRTVYATHQRRMEPQLATMDWQNFLDECVHRDASVANWSDSTRAKLFQVIVRMLVEAKYLDNARALRLTPRSLHPDVRRYLNAHNQPIALECLERAP